MELTFYTCKSDLDNFKKHKFNIAQLIEQATSDKYEIDFDEFDNAEYSNNIPVRIIIEDIKEDEDKISI